jgi:hypothetical protein
MVEGKAAQNTERNVAPVHGRSIKWRPCRHQPQQARKQVVQPARLYQKSQ